MDATASRKATVACSSCGRLNRVDLSRAADRPKCGACGRPIALDRPLAVTDATFDRVVGGSDVPVLVDFYADWCGPCKIMAPVLDAVAQSRAGSILVAKLDTDRNPAIARRFQIASIPTLIVFRGGREVGRELGAIPPPAAGSAAGWRSEVIPFLAAAQDGRTAGEKHHTETRRGTESPQRNPSCF